MYTHTTHKQHSGWGRCGEISAARDCPNPPARRPQARRAQPSTKHSLIVTKAPHFIFLGDGDKSTLYLYPMPRDLMIDNTHMLQYIE